MSASELKETRTEDKYNPFKTEATSGRQIKNKLSQTNGAKTNMMVHSGKGGKL